MEPRDLLKKLHPNQFSDSKIIDKIECPRELQDFHLSKLSEQNKHFDAINTLGKCLTLLYKEEADKIGGHIC